MATISSSLHSLISRDQLHIQVWCWVRISFEPVSSRMCLLRSTEALMMGLYPRCYIMPELSVSLWNLVGASAKKIKLHLVTLTTLKKLSTEVYLQEIIDFGLFRIF